LVFNGSDGTPDDQHGVEESGFVTRIAVLSDIHGNSFALGAVLEAVSAANADLVVNLGDSLSGAIDPRATAETLGAHPGFVTIRGNHDRQLLELAADRMRGVERIADAAVTDADRLWLSGARPVAPPVPGILAFHGSPVDDLCYLLETVEPTGLREASDDEVIDRLGSAYGHYAAYLCGHTHLQRSRVLPDGSLVVNPGSVGWPAFADDEPHPHVIEAGSPHARFSVIEHVGGRWIAQEHAIDYDHEAAAACAELHGRHDIAYALRTGRVGPGSSV
jgi:predicted phosphodiesterase